MDYLNTKFEHTVSSIRDSFQESWTTLLLNQKLLSIKMPLVVLFDIKASDSKISSFFIYATAHINRTERRLVGKRYNKNETNKKRQGIISVN